MNDELERRGLEVRTRAGLETMILVACRYPAFEGTECSNCGQDKGVYYHVGDEQANFALLCDRCYRLALN